MINLIEQKVIIFLLSTFPFGSYFKYLHIITFHNIDMRKRKTQFMYYNNNNNNKINKPNLRPHKCLLLIN